jgi:hypothetical protein
MPRKRKLVKHLNPILHAKRPKGITFEEQMEIMMRRQREEAKDKEANPDRAG